MEKILVTGSSGFIGMHLCENLLKENYSVAGVDNMNDYYDIRLKEKRLENLSVYKNFKFYKADIANADKINLIFDSFRPNKVVNLAAQAGVRYRLVNPHAYIESNILGFMNILDASRDYDVEGLIYASSSSVYGESTKTELSVEDRTDSPISIYATSKRTNELMAHSYSHLYGLNTTGLRFFTVYGPWGRPDMAMYIFANKIMNNEVLQVFNHGKMKRDFTYIDDIISGTKSAIVKNYKNEIFNLGNNQSEDLMRMIKIIESCLGKDAKIKFVDMQLGDVKNTWADIDYSKVKLGYEPQIPIQKGIPKFIDWFLDYYQRKL